MKEKIIAQGAEAILLRRGDLLVKKRIKKSYRIKEIDEKLRKLRTRHEAKIMEKASEIIDVPKIISSSEDKKEIVMEFIVGKKLSDFLDSMEREKQKKICNEIGKTIAKLHEANIIHSDLTTSNMIYKKGRVYFIDFGLSYHSQRIEDKAVDLHLLRQALQSKHYKNWEKLFKWVVNGYKNYDKATEVLERLEKVEKRGRYKH